MVQILSLTRNGQRPADLAQELGVSERTIFRYLSRLSCNYPLYQDNGRYKLIENYHGPNIPLTINELMALNVAIEGLSRQKGTPYAMAVKTAKFKIESTILGNNSIEHCKHILFAPPGFVDYRPHEKHFELLNKAINGQEILNLDYQPLGREILGYQQIHPYGLFFRRSAWYFVGFYPEKKDFGLFRVDRIKNIQPTGEKFKKDENFVLSRFVGESWGTFRGEEVEVRVVFKGEAAHLVKEKQRHPSQQIQKLEDGTVLLTAKIRGWQEFAWWLLSFGGEVKVLEPECVREEMIRKAKEILEVY